jgi:hypothetical protein
MLQLAETRISRTHSWQIFAVLSWSVSGLEVIHQEQECARKCTVVATSNLSDKAR